MGSTASSIPSSYSHASDIVQNMRRSRNAPAVHKTKLATIRAQNPNRIVFVCEGVDDKKVYFHWLRHTNPLLNYEFQVCNGKEPLLEFRELLKRDKSDLIENTFFFVDRDFDDLLGYSPGSDIYVSESYSFENLIVTKEVLDNVLKIELHCHGDYLIRDKVLTAFGKIYDSFLTATRPHNERIFMARRLGIKTKSLPNRLAKLADVTLTEIIPQQEGLTATINLDREPTQQEIDLVIDEFNELNPQLHYRGKFALLFFLKWIDLLGKDRNAENSIFFSEAYKSGAKANGQLTLDSVAAKSVPPKSFGQFIKEATTPNKNSF